MWKCVRCGFEIPFEGIEPAIDDLGIYFICPVCRRRNKLINVGKPDGPIELMQPDE